MCSQTEFPAIVAMLVVVFSNRIVGLRYLGWVQWLCLVPHLEYETCISGFKHGIFRRNGRKLGGAYSLL
jgi:hypothetical protein